MSEAGDTAAPALTGLPDLLGSGSGDSPAEERVTSRARSLTDTKGTDQMPVSPFIEVDGLTVTHGDVAAVRDVSFEVRSREPSDLLGTNGAGGTSTLEVVDGHRPSRRCGPQALRAARLEYDVASWFRLGP